MPDMISYTKDSICAINRNNGTGNIVGYVHADGPQIHIHTQNGDLTVSAANEYEFKTPDLGYIQLGNKAYYVQRQPKRMWKVGLTSRNTNYPQIFAKGIPPLVQAFQKLSNREFAPLNSIIGKLRNNDTSFCISRRYAVKRGGLLYRDEQVAEFSVKNKTLVFDDEYSLDFHRNNIISLGFGEYDFQAKKSVSFRDYNYDTDV